MDHSNCEDSWNLRSSSIRRNRLSLRGSERLPCSSSGCLLWIQGTSCLSRIVLVGSLTSPCLYIDDHQKTTFCGLEAKGNDSFLEEIDLDLCTKKKGKHRILKNRIFTNLLRLDRDLELDRDRCRLRPSSAKLD